MKALFVFDRPLYPLRGGAESRAFDHLHYLESRNIEYDLFLIDKYFNYNQWNKDSIEMLLDQRRVNKVFLHQVLGKSSFDAAYHKLLSKFYKYINKEPSVLSLIHFLPFMRRNFRSIVRNNRYDFIFFNHTYISNALVSGFSIPCKTYIDIHDIHSNLIQESLDLKKLYSKVSYSGSLRALTRNKVRDFDYHTSFSQELKVLRKFNKVITISNEELNILKQDESLSSNSILIPKINFSNNTISTYAKSYNNSLEGGINQKFKLLFFGSQYDPNVHGISSFYYNVIPYLNHQVEILVAGGVSSYFLNKKHPQLRVLGFVDNISDLYKSADAVIVPIFYGSGVSIKAIEALSYGKPVISTLKGVRGLSLEYGKDVLIAEDIHAFIPLIEKLRLNSNLYNSLSDNALKYIQKYHSEEIVYSKMDSIFLS
ncbi:glycosyltransferase [Pseudanabaena sp. BC1403]|uniref:glycosyltransferase n=1 Tax=Pseudanabaena sp. BC1403 TaxID=2043171 RepID=UPI000CD936A6|nr:glycosyltransferase [Pseudanabaena sp. BC1403]